VPLPKNLLYLYESPLASQAADQSIPASFAADLVRPPQTSDSSSVSGFAERTNCDDRMNPNQVRWNARGRGGLIDYRPRDPKMIEFKPDRLIAGDCVDGLRSLADNTVDLAIADPPFNIGYGYDVYQDRRKADDYLAWSKTWIGEVARVLNPSGTFWLAIGDEFAAELKVIAHRDVGLTLRSWVIWYYTFGVNCKKKFSRSHAHLFYFVKNAKEFTFNDAAIRVPSARQRVYADARANPSGRLPDDTWILRPQDAPESFTPEEDTWYVPRVCGTFKERAGWHGCQMPEQLLGRIIRACSNPGDLVLDPFAGSGTSLVTAKKLDRRYLGFELSPDYAAQAQNRLDETTIGDPLSGGEEPMMTQHRKRRTTGPDRALSLS